MIGLDTNILIRYLTQDDPVQSRTATALIEGKLTALNPGYIGIVALVETVWVLSRSYRLSNREIASHLSVILSAETLVVDSEPEVYKALVAFEEDGADFGDALLAALASKAGCTHTVTFDRRASRLPDMQLLT